MTRSRDIGGMSIGKFGVALFAGVLVFGLVFVVLLLPWSVGRHESARRISAITAAFTDERLRVIAEDEVAAREYTQAIERICARRRADQCTILDRAGVPARWNAIRRETSLPNAFEIEIDQLMKGDAR
ncbi:MAG: hypothetical protein IBJ15_00260 [Alphaproteobacteria bacterium]|nr:hypothetical protein [Alphaproteobacteria bacterium]